MTRMGAGALALAAIGLLTVGQGCQDGGKTPGSAASTVDLGSEEAKTLYALGVTMGGSLSSLGLSAEEIEAVKMGLLDAASGVESKVDLAVYRPKIAELANTRRALQADAEKGRSQDFLEQAASEEGAVTTESGLIYIEITEGEGIPPTIGDVVTVHYRGTLTDGKQFDSSYDRGQPAQFPLQGVIPCWTEGVQMMKTGGKAKLICPPDIAYGDAGSPPVIPPGATLVFEVELIGISQQ
jgi:FKBP-type peptidyl-prolyl cis-trans isomerase FkpA